MNTSPSTPNLESLRQAIQEFQPNPRRVPFNNLKPLHDAIVELRGKNASYAIIAELLIQNGVKTSVARVAEYGRIMVDGGKRRRRRKYARTTATAIQVVPPAPKPAPQISASTSFQAALKPERGPRISARNLRLMIQFFDEYPAFGPIWQRAVAKLSNDPTGGKKEPTTVSQLPAESDAAQIWQRAVAQLTWAHNVILIQKVKDLPTRLWYARQAFEHGWSRDVLSLQIQSLAHERHGNAVTNFQRTLPPPQSDLASQLLKDPYFFDFLTLEKPFHERELETGLLRHLQHFLVELGTGFAFVGRQVHMEGQGSTFKSISANDLLSKDSGIVPETHNNGDNVIMIKTMKLINLLMPVAI